MKKKTATKRKPIKYLPGDRKLENVLERMIRVNHAGEFGAQRIYAGQLSVLGDTKVGPVIRQMALQEDQHLAAFEKVMIERGVRPTILHPLWHIAGFALGAMTARMGKEAAMACTVAVEEVIDEHYRKQLERLANEDEPQMRKMITKFRADENEHEAMGRKHGAEDAAYYHVLRSLVRASSKTAIWLSERI